MPSSRGEDSSIEYGAVERLETAVFSLNAARRLKE
jgi:hypothetical protein